MKIHEYQARKLMETFGIPVPKGDVAETIEGGLRIAEDLLNSENKKIFIKAQVHAGGRGKAGGIQSATDSEEAKQALQRVLGMRLITKQTGKEGKLVRKVMVVAGCPDIERELYVGIILDRQKECPVIMASSAGGMEIEEVAAQTPELIFKEHIHPLLGINQFNGRRLAKKLQLSGNLFRQAVELFSNLYKMFTNLDCSQIEINPLAVTQSGKIIALDAKINFDDSAFFRHPELTDLRDLSEESDLEVKASQHGLNYIKLDGNIGCMVNGAGLAMATMDIIKHYGASPANFLDIGGGANEEAITEAFKILLSDEDVKAVLVNIFGGIVRCDRVAKGIINAAQRVDLDRPLVVRLVGTNAEEGNHLLMESGLPIVTANNMANAAQKIIAELPGGGR
ncbi:ADP-forming succinate--CoA ligase subunit beta [bacterium]|nr:ADP-forming succinate--CoA ligase subunit beta [candidate division CSSED10-310 bacterium]